MSVRTSAPLGAPTWIDLASSDVERSQEFHRAVFGWTFESAGPDYGGYVNAFCGGRPVAGLMHNDPQWNSPDGWTTYFHTTDMRATLQRALAAGAVACVDPVEPMQIGDKGWMGMLTDPTGAFFGLWQPAGHRGFEVVDENGAPVYFQLTTCDHAKALDFYRETFGWQIETVSDTDEFRYSTANFDGKALLGVMSWDVEPDWCVFLGADDVDRTVQLVLDHGGSVRRGAEDTPYGRLAAVTDCTGAAFNLSSLG
ncbi:VOC family protein [Mycobacterium sp. PS03-16]|uniref:VOC family protein n=1 Tax=Mycobacterium sp. PS03-16 TaxID=2559611 RepID=UPI001073D36D|nr:VOC family protein [Mycobacterium sp. PS03-16]TFV61170.1 VOC family protein [Mycobacterium sp. PS03-16]